MGYLSGGTSTEEEPAKPSWPHFLPSLPHPPLFNPLLLLLNINLPPFALLYIFIIRASQLFSPTTKVKSPPSQKPPDLVELGWIWVMCAPKNSHRFENLQPRGVKPGRQFAGCCPGSLLVWLELTSNKSCSEWAPSGWSRIARPTQGSTGGE